MEMQTAYNVQGETSSEHARMRWRRPQRNQCGGTATSPKQIAAFDQDLKRVFSRENHVRSAEPVSSG